MMHPESGSPPHVPPPEENAASSCCPCFEGKEEEEYDGLDSEETLPSGNKGRKQQNNRVMHYLLTFRAFIALILALVALLEGQLAKATRDVNLQHHRLEHRLGENTTSNVTALLAATDGGLIVRETETMRTLRYSLHQEVMVLNDNNDMTAPSPSTSSVTEVHRLLNLKSSARWWLHELEEELAPCRELRHKHYAIAGLLFAMMTVALLSLAASFLCPICLSLHRQKEKKDSASATPNSNHSALQFLFKFAMVMLAVIQEAMCLSVIVLSNNYLEVSPCKRNNFPSVLRQHVPTSEWAPNAWFTWCFAFPTALTLTVFVGAGMYACTMARLRYLKKRSISRQKEDDDDEFVDDRQKTTRDEEEDRVVGPPRQSASEEKPPLIYSSTVRLSRSASLVHQEENSSPLLAPLSSSSASSLVNSFFAPAATRTQLEEQGGGGGSQEEQQNHNNEHHQMRDTTRRATLLAIDHLGRTVLHRACSSQNTNLIFFNQLCEDCGGVDAVNLPDQQGNTPLFYCCRYDRADLATTLLKFKASMNPPRGPVLAFACYYGASRLANLIMREHPDSLWLRTPGGLLPDEAAMLKRHVSLASLVREQRRTLATPIHLEGISDHGSTPLSGGRSPSSSSFGGRGRVLTDSATSATFGDRTPSREASVVLLSSGRTVSPSSLVHSHVLTQQERAETASTSRSAVGGENVDENINVTSLRTPEVASLSVSPSHHASSSLALSAGISSAANLPRSGNTTYFDLMIGHSEDEPQPMVLMNARSSSLPSHGAGGGASHSPPLANTCTSQSLPSLGDRPSLGGSSTNISWHEDELVT